MINTIQAYAKKTLAGATILAVAFGSFGVPLLQPVAANAAAPASNWNVTGSYVVDMAYQGSSNPHDMHLVEDNAGNLTGTGGSPAGANTYTWAIDSGTVSGDSVNFSAHYTATADAVTPLTTLVVAGTVAPDGTLSGTWSDNYQGTARSGSLSTTSGHASAYGTIAAQDFGIENQGGVKGYTAGFGLTNATFASSTSVVVQLFSGATLLQTDTLSGPNAASITGAQISAPFDIFGTFNYATDGYWTNVRAAEYGQTMIPTSVTATVTLADGHVVTVTNSNPPTGDRSTIVPVQSPSVTPVTLAATMVTATDATLNGMNGTSDASGHSFWVSLAPFATSSTALPAGVYSTPDLGAIAANAASSALLSSVSGMPAVTASTTYYFAAWSNVGGTWYPGTELSFTTVAANNGGTIGGTVTGGTPPPTPGVLAVTSVTAVKTTAVADGTFASGWIYTFNITVPTNETHLSMKFADWMSAVGSTTLAAANDMRISSVQADNADATVLVSAANAYTVPLLNMTGDLNPALDGNQVQVKVEVAVPSTTVNGSYTTNYGVKTQ